MTEKKKKGTYLETKPEIREQILTVLRLGCKRETACDIAGIGRRTFYDWLQRGEAGEPFFEQFLQDVIQAEASVEVEMMAIEFEAAKTEVKSRHFILERVRGFTGKETVEVTVRPLPLDQTALESKDLASLLRAKKATQALLTDGEDE